MRRRMMGWLIETVYIYIYDGEREKHTQITTHFYIFYDKLYHK